MKINRLLLLTCFLFAGFQAWAQPHQGSVLLGGTAGFSSTSQDNISITIFSFAPKAGFFITDRFALGGEVNLTFYGGDGSGSLVSLSPLVRYYFNGEGATRFFGQGSITWQNIKPGGGFDGQSAFGFGAGVGMDYFFNEHVALEAIVGYNSLKGENDGGAVNTFGIQLGVAAFIGK